MAYHPLMAWGCLVGRRTPSRRPIKITGNIYGVVYWTICILIYFLTVVHLFDPRKDEAV